MSRVYNNPEEVDYFAAALRHFITDLDGAVANLNSAFNTLGDSWQDEQRYKFEEEYEELLRYLEQFSDNAENQIAHLSALARELRDYLGS